MEMSYDNNILSYFMVVTFLIVPIRVYIANRRDNKYIPYFLGQIVFGMLWFLNVGLGMILVAQIMMLGNYLEFVYVTFIYGFLTALANVFMLFLNQKKQADFIAKQKSANSTPKAKFKRKFSVKRKGVKHLK